MKLKLSRRGIYVGTIVAMLAMIGGFALASLAGGFTHSTVTGQNFGSVSGTANTIYSGGFTVTLLASSAGTGCQSGAITGSTTIVAGVETDNVFVEGAANSCSASGEWYEEFSFVPASTAACGGASCVDTLSFATTTGGTTTSTAFTLTTTAAATTEDLNVFVDDGPTAGGALPISITSVSVVASGS